MQRIPIDGFVVNVTAVAVNDVEESAVLCAVVQGTVATAHCWKVTRAGAVTHLGSSEPLGKDNSAAAIIYADGTVRVYVSEADPGGAGSTSHIDSYDVAGAVSPLPSGGGVDSIARSMIKQLAAAIRDAAARFA